MRYDSACFANHNESKIPVRIGKVGQHLVETLRDTGCSSVLVRKDFVTEDQYTGEAAGIRLADGSIRREPIAKIKVDTPYLCGEVEAVCLSNAVYGLIVGNVPTARPADDPDPTWNNACAVTTRAGVEKAKKKRNPLIVPGTNDHKEVCREELVKLQHEDTLLDKLWDKTEPIIKGQQKTYYETRDQVLYRIYQQPYVNVGKPVTQVVVPLPLRQQVMEGT